MKKNNNFSKDDLVFYFRKFDFPKNLILNEALVHKDLLFSDHPIDPEALHQTKKKLKFSDSFILEEELESKKNSFKKGKQINFRSDHNITKGNAFGSQPNTWRKNEFEDPGFFDNFKGNINDKNNTIGPKEITASADDLFNNSENLFTGNNEGYANNISKKNQKVNNSSRKNSNQINERKTSINSLNYFTEDYTLSPIKAKFTPLSKEEKTITFLNSDPKKIDFRNIHRINKYLNYGKDEPLWYIFHPIAKSSFGPCSSENLEEMYSGGMVDGQSEVRFIDIYNVRNKKPFEFFKLKDLEEVKIIDDIEISALVKNALLLDNIEIANKYDNYQGNKNNNNNNSNNNQNKNKKHRKTSSIVNNQPINEGQESRKESNNSNNQKVTSPKDHPKEKKKNEKKEPKDLNSLLEKVLKNDIKNKDKKDLIETTPGEKILDENKTEKKESSQPIIKEQEKNVVEISNIPSIEEVIKKDQNKSHKDKVNKAKKTKAKPVELNIKLKFEDSSANSTTPSNLASNTLTNLSSKVKNQKDEKPKTSKAKDSAMKKEELLNSIYDVKSIENKQVISTKETNDSNVSNISAIPEVNTTSNTSNTGIETIKVTYDDSIYNKNNYDYEKEYYNEYDYYGSGNRTNTANQNANKNKTKKQKSKNNATEKNDYYGQNYQYDEGYNKANYQQSNKNYYNNQGVYNKQQSYKSNSNNNYEY